MKKLHRNALVITGVNLVPWLGVAPKYVLCGASEPGDNYYWGDWPAPRSVPAPWLVPAADLNDAEGGDLTDEEALKAACDALVNS